VGDCFGEEGLAGAGGPVEEDSLRDPGAEDEKRFGCWRKSTTSWSSEAASSTPAMSSQPTADFESARPPSASPAA
jgi:hypothetical protein